MTDHDESTIDVHDYLRQRRQIAIIWVIDDVKQQRPDLTDDQAWDVLLQCERVHDCNYGFTWDLIDFVAEDMYPEPLDSPSDGAGV